MHYQLFTGQWLYLVTGDYTRQVFLRARVTITKSGQVSLCFLLLVYTEHELWFCHLATALEHTALWGRVLLQSILMEYLRNVLPKKRNWEMLYSTLSSWRFTRHLRYSRFLQDGSHPCLTQHFLSLPGQVTLPYSHPSTDNLWTSLRTNMFRETLWEIFFLTNKG